MGIPSASILSGKLAMGSGIICLIGAAVFYSKRIKKQLAEKAVTLENPKPLPNILDESI